MRPPTIRDVAKEADVGVGTVSRVLNNSQQVRPETRARVLAAIQKLGFRPSKIARQLSRGARTQNVGVILPYVTNYSFVERLRGVQIALSESDNNYELILYNVSSSQRYENQLFSIVQHGLVEGLLIIDLDVSQQQHELLDEAGIAFVGINGLCDTGWPRLGPDNVAGGHTATQYLLNLGHSRVAYVGDKFPDNYGFPTSKGRHNGYVNALNMHGIAIDPSYVRLGQFGRDVAQSLTFELISSPNPPTAIFAMSDVQALGSLAAIRKAGLRVPDDISVIGFDDIEVSSHAGLTTVRQHLEESGYIGMQYLLHLLRGDAPASMPSLPALEIVVRQTTGPPCHNT